MHTFYGSLVTFYVSNVQLYIFTAEKMYHYLFIFYVNHFMVWFTQFENVALGSFFADIF